MTDIEVSRNETRSRWEATSEGEAAGYADYRLGEDVVVFPHTVVDPAFEGRGVGSALARTSLDDARERGLKVRADCAFYARWIDRHPEYQDLLVETG